MNSKEREQAKKDILKLMELGMDDKAEEYLRLCIQIYGEDPDFCQMQDYLLMKKIPGIAVLCFCEKEEEINDVEQQIDYPKYHLIRIETGTPGMLKRIWDEIENTEYKYIAFWERRSEFCAGRLTEMVYYLAENNLGLATCFIRFIQADGETVSYHDRFQEKIFAADAISGTKLMELCMNQKINLYGHLSCFLADRERLLEKKRMLEGFDDGGEYFPFIFECLYDIKMGAVPSELVYLREEKLDLDILEKKNRVMNRLIDWVAKGELLQINKTMECLPSVFRRQINTKRSIKMEVVPDIMRKITFFYTDKGEYFNVEPIALEAQKRGFQVEFTEDVHRKAEIGVYCQHVCYPENAKFSLVLLHDMAQGNTKWPDIWNNERWDEFDIAILPGEEWARRWAQCSGRCYVHPKCGIFGLGYPKGDICNSQQLNDRVKEYRELLNFKYPVTVLYAPSWEYGDKEADFINALQSMQVNLLIKQANWEPEVKFIIQNIKDMRKKHEGKFDNVYYIEPEESILVALQMCDLVVSDESSVMTEALLYKKPSIAVTDWEIPDTDPPRQAVFPGEYVYKCSKEQLRQSVELMLSEIGKGNSLPVGGRFFDNQGRCSSDIVDLIEYMIGGEEKPSCLSRELVPEYMPYTLWGV